MQATFREGEGPGCLVEESATGEILDSDLVLPTDSGS